MPREVDQGPGLTCILEERPILPEEPGGEAKQATPAIPGVVSKLLRLKRMRSGQGGPAGLHFRQRTAAYRQRKNVLGDSAQDRLGRRRLVVQLFERFPPPGEPDLADHRLPAGDKDPAETDVKTPESL
jgi:hypothetical protein